MKAAYLYSSTVVEFRANVANLLDAVKGRQIDGWSTKIRIGRDLAKIIGTAHALPERVLHRDLRPSNIMLKDFYSDPDDWKVVVLDFDLSWHRGAIERSVMHSTALGYLAPEQIRASATASTRHAAVDSFGFGMTMYFLFTGQDPIPEQHKHQGWQQTLRSKIGSRTCHEWKSVPTRVVRMIEFATQDEQSKRWDMGQLLSELTQLSQAISNPSTVESAELVAEELAAHCGSLSNYGWNFDRGAATTHLPSGIIIEVFGHEVHKLVRLLLRWVGQEWRNERELARP